MNDMDFSNKISNTNFQSEDIFPLAYNASDKVIITNFPNANTPIYIPQKSEESFQITVAELTTYNPVPDLLDSQQISFRNTATLAFDIANKQLKVTSSGTIAYPNFKDTKYFLFKIRDSSGTIKKSSAIKADENANTFAKELNNTSFNFGDTIELTCFAINQITISNMPATGQTTSIDKIIFNSEARQGFFKIAKQGLQEYSPAMPLPTTTLPNTIKINTITNANCLAINFNTLDKVFQTFSFSKFADNSSKYDYVIARLYDKNHTLIITSTIPSNDDSSSIRTGLITKIFDYDYILDLTYDYRARPNILITNINGQNHIPDNFNERYKITNSGLEFISSFLTNIITINSISNMPVAFIEFNKLDQKLKGTPTNNKADSSSKYNYIIFKLYHLPDSTLAYPFFTATLTSNSAPIDFTSIINKGYFIKDCILEITCDNKALNKVTISNFQTPGTTYTISTNKEYFKVTDNGLTKFAPQSILTNNKVLITAFNASESDALELKFDANSKKINATATNDPIGYVYSNWSTASAFIYKLKDTNGNVVKSDYVYANDNLIIGRNGVAIDLANNLNGTTFNYGYSLELYAPAEDYNAVYRVGLIISNVILNSRYYWKIKDTETVSITPLGLVLQSDSHLGKRSLSQNIISLNSLSKYLLLNLYFINETKKIFVASTSANSNYASGDYFVFILKDKLGAQKTISRIIAGADAVSFANALNNFSFEYGDTVTLQCATPNNTSILNYINYNNTYLLQMSTETFTITELGLMKFLKNEITFLGYDNNLISKIYFSLGHQKLFVYSTGTTAHSGFNNNIYFEVILRDSFGIVTKHASVKGNENADNFASILNFSLVQPKYSIEIRFIEKDRVSVSNYPNDGETYKSPDNNPKAFIITEQGLISSLLKNEITFLGLGDNLIATIQFNIALKKLLVTSTRTEAHSYFPNQEYFAFVLKDGSGSIVKEASVKGNENATNFATILNNTDFQYGYIIEVRFKEKNRFLVSNYPNDGETYKSPDNNPKTFTITKDSLVLKS